MKDVFWDPHDCSSFIRNRTPHPFGFFHPNPQGFKAWQLSVDQRTSQGASAPWGWSIRTPKAKKERQGWDFFLFVEKLRVATFFLLL